MSKHIKIGDREYNLQEAYEWPLAIYLFFGGLSGALITIGVVIKFLGFPNFFVITSIVSSLISMSIAGLFLVLFELMRPLVAWRSLFNWKHSGITWDVILVSLVIGGGFLFILPYIIDLGYINKVLVFLNPFIGILTILAGVLFPIISGGLLSSYHTVPLWHGPSIPILMFLTSFNSAFAYFVLVFSSYLNNNDILRLFWGFILSVTIFVILILISYIETIKNGPFEAKLSLDILKRNKIFVIGFILIGLIVPAIISAWLLFGTYSQIIAILGAISAILGGFILRHYLLKAGVQLYPWPY